VFLQSAFCERRLRPDKQYDELCLSMRSGFGEHGFQLGPRGRDTEAAPFGDRGQCLATCYTQGNLGFCRSQTKSGV
jgi:hypothetical protein